MKKFTVVGIDDFGRMAVNPSFLQNHRVFSGGVRHYELVKNILPEEHEWIPVTIPLSNVFEQYKDKNEIVVFASGDPLFYGFATTIIREMQGDDVNVYPYFNSLQTIAHRMNLAYQDMHNVSLTGRPWHEFDRSIIEGYSLIGVLTDKKHTPKTIAERMLDYGYDNYKMTVGEILGNSEEKIRTFNLDEINKYDFNTPNSIILQKTHNKSRDFGLDESKFEFLNGRSKMITKMPIRLISLSMLDLRNRQTMWDIGFCTGSVSIEAKLQFPHLKIFSFEKRQEGKHLMETNARKFSVPGINYEIGDFTEIDLGHHDNPDAVFIGGHGGNMKGIFEIISNRIMPDGVVVFNSVSEETKLMFINAVNDFGFRLHKSILIKVDENNPIEVMKASIS